MDVIPKYWTPETVVLANNLLPTVLVGKTNKEIMEYLDGDEVLRSKLNQFSNQTYKALIARQQGRNFGCFQVDWENVGGITHLCFKEMWQLNYLLYVPEDSWELSQFIFAVLYVVKRNLNGYLKQTLVSQGLDFCKPIQ
jgi:hypothetical protein